MFGTFNKFNISNISFSTKNKQIISIVIIGILFIGVFAAVYLAQKSQDIREKAAVQEGTATVVLVPGSSQLSTIPSSSVSQ